MKNTKKALLLSVMSLLLCVSMLVGTTFAWFTDSVSTGKNVIAAGNLDVELYWSTDCEDWVLVTEQTNVFGAAKWEPGHTEVVYLKVANEGSLHLKYQLGVNVVSEITSTAVTGDPLKLSEHILYGVAETDTKYADRAAARAALGTAVSLENAYSSDIISLAPKGQENDTETVALVVYMPETVGNEANHKTGAAEPTINLGLNVFATQVEAESDSFGKDYDAAAPYDLPSGVSAEDFGDNVALVNGTYYSTLKGALEGIHANAEAGIATVAEAAEPTVLYLKPGADLGTVTHAHVCSDLIVYGNGAYISGGEADFEVDTYKYCHNGAKQCAGLTGDLTLVIRELNGVAVWGQRNTAYDVNVELYNCQDMNRVFISGTSGENNISIEGCSFNGANACAVYSNANGTISVKDTTFANVGEPINLNHKVAGTQTVNVEGCDFVNCGNLSVDANLWATSIRVLSSAADAKSVLTVKDVTFTGAEGLKLNGDIVLNDTITGTVAGTVEANLSVPNDAVVVAYDGATVTGAATTAPVKYVQVKDDTQIDEAIKAGSTALVLGSGNYIIPDSAQGKTLTIIGNGETVVATQDDGSYEGCDYSLDGSTVTFENITINTDSRTYTGYARLKATYNNCIINGTYTLYDESVFNNCTFNVSGDVYNIWTWGASTAEFNNCTFNSDGKALLLYGTVNTKLTLNDCVFNDNGGLTDLKAAVEIGNDYGKSYELIVNNTVVNGYEINDKGINTGSTLWGNKNSMGTDKLNVVIDGVDVY